MTEFVKAVIIRQSNSGVPRDAVENTIYVSKASAFTSTNFDDITSAVEGFFNATASGSGGPIKNNLAADGDYTALHEEIKFYAMPSTPGPLFSPVAITHWTLGAPAAAVQPLPDQVAIAISFHADLSAAAEEAGATRPRSRRRGRIFIGPLNISVMEEAAGATGPQTVNPAILTNFNATAAAFLAALTSVGLQWVVWSSKDWTGRPVVGGWTDDRFDTQRRRLHDADTRVIWP